MSFLNKIGEFFVGGAMEGASKVADIVERWKPGVTTRHEMEMDVAELVNGARVHDQVTPNGGIFGNIANALNRLIRPVVTIYVLGGVFGFFEVTYAANIDPWFLAQAERIIVFWFGGKLLIKDIPAAIKYLRR